MGYHGRTLFTLEIVIITFFTPISSISCIFFQSFGPLHIFSIVRQVGGYVCIFMERI